MFPWKPVPCYKAAHGEPVYPCPRKPAAGRRARLDLSAGLGRLHRRRTCDVGPALRAPVGDAARPRVGGLPARHRRAAARKASPTRSEEHTTELQTLMRISYARFCLKKKKNNMHRQPRKHI